MTAAAVVAVAAAVWARPFLCLDRSPPAASRFREGLVEMAVAAAMAASESWGSLR
jgi:hypothetical protein